VGPNRQCSARGPGRRWRISSAAGGFLLVELNHEWGPIPRGPGPTRGQSSISSSRSQGPAEHAPSLAARGILQPRLPLSHQGLHLLNASGGATSCRTPAGVGEGPGLLERPTGDGHTLYRSAEEARQGEQRPLPAIESPNEKSSITLEAACPWASARRFAWVPCLAGLALLATDGLEIANFLITKAMQNSLAR